MFARWFGSKKSGRQAFREELARLDEFAWGEVGVCDRIEETRRTCGDSVVPFLVVDSQDRLARYAKGLCADPALLDQAISVLVMARMYATIPPQEESQNVRIQEGRQQQGRREEGQRGDARPDEADGEARGAEGEGEVGHRELRRPDGVQGTLIQ